MAGAADKCKAYVKPTFVNGDGHKDARWDYNFTLDTSQAMTATKSLPLHHWATAIQQM